MLTNKDISQIYEKDFDFICRTKFYVEFQSKDTKHCWIINKHGSPGEIPVWLFHKHSKEEPCYHLHKKHRTVSAALKEVIQHDLYQMGGRKEIFDNLRK